MNSCITRSRCHILDHVTVTGQLFRWVWHFVRDLKDNKQQQADSSPQDMVHLLQEEDPVRSSGKPEDMLKDSRSGRRQGRLWEPQANGTCFQILPQCQVNGHLSAGEMHLSSLPLGYARYPWDKKKDIVFTSTKDLSERTREQMICSRVSPPHTACFGQGPTGPCRQPSR
jgi:hypothetical protein